MPQVDNRPFAGGGDDKLVFFGHHKCGSRFFRKTLLEPLTTANGYDVVAYRITDPPFHFRSLHDLDLCNVDFGCLSRPGRTLLNLTNASEEVVARVRAAAPDLRGIHVVRDPCQCLVSGYFHHRDGHPVESRLGWVWNQLKEDRVALKRLSLEDGLLYELDHITGDVLRNQIEAWVARPGVLEFKLEDFVGADSYAWPQVERLVDFLGIQRLPPLRFQSTFANEASRPWREVFTPRLTRAFKERWGELLISLDYETSYDW